MAKPAKATPLPKFVPRPWSYGCLGGAFEAGDDAYGLRFLQTGFGRTPEDDRLFALGYPHLVIPVEVDVDLAKLSADNFADYYPWHTGVWPRALIERFLAHSGPPKGALATKPVAPLDFVTIAPKIALLERPYGGVYLYFLEALFGSARTLEAVLAAWEGVKDWTERESFTEIPHAMPFLLLRVDEKTRTAALLRLAVVHGRAEKQCAALPGEPARCVGALAVAAGQPPSKDAMWTMAYAAPGDRATIDRITTRLAEIGPTDRARFDARLAFLGGAATAQALSDAVAVPRFHASWQRAITEQLPRIAHPSVAKAMTKLASRDANAKTWLDEAG